MVSLGLVFLGAVVGLLPSTSCWAEDNSTHLPIDPLPETFIELSLDPTESLLPSQPAAVTAPTPSKPPPVQGHSAKVPFRQAGPQRAPARSPRVPTQTVRWQLGPRVIRWGEQQLELVLPASYRVAQGAEARQLMAQLGIQQPLTDSLVVTDLVEPTRWLVVMEHDSIGHVVLQQADALSTAFWRTMLEKTNHQLLDDERRRRLEKPAFVSWAHPPEWDAALNEVQWGLLLQRPADGIAQRNQSVLLFGRRGVLQVTLLCTADEYVQVRPHLFHLLTLTRFVANEGYEAFIPGVDALYPTTLPELVSGGLPLEHQKAYANSQRPWHDPARFRELAWYFWQTWTGKAFVALTVLLLISLVVWRRAAVTA